MVPFRFTHLAPPAAAFSSAARGALLLTIGIFLVGMFFGVEAARAEGSAGAKYVLVHADIVKFQDETDEHATKRVARILGEANTQGDEANAAIGGSPLHFILAAVTFHEPSDAPSMFTILRDEVTRARDQGWIGNGRDRRLVILFETRAFGGQEGLAMLGSGCTDNAVAVVGTHGYTQADFVADARTVLHEAYHIFNVAHFDFTVPLPGTEQLVATLMHSHAVGTFLLSEQSLQQFSTYVASLKEEDSCLRDSPPPSLPPVLALTTPIEMREGESRTIDVPVPGLGPDYELCSLRYDKGTVPFYTGEMTDAAIARIQLTAARDAVQARGGVVSYEFRVSLRCLRFDTDQLYQVRVSDFDLSPIIVAPVTVFPFRSGRTVNVTFWSSNPAGVAGAPVVRCAGLPRTSRIQKRGNAYTFAVRAYRNTAVSCSASNSEGTTSVNFQLNLQRGSKRH